MKAQILFDSTHSENRPNWLIVDDTVMGGRSSGQIEFTVEGYAKFYGEVSLENNGGFSSVRFETPTVEVNPRNQIRVYLKGDGSTFQFRVKHQRKSYYSYNTVFKTNGQWQQMEFKLNDLYPTFRGRRLDLPNFNNSTLEEITFLIGNKKAQEFELLIKRIEYLDEAGYINKPR